MTRSTEAPVEWGEMSARERDALVAERVMGWTYQQFPDGLMPEVKHWSTPGGRVRTLRLYSTVIVAAWEVVEAMQQREWWAKLLYHVEYAHGRDPVWTAEFRQVALAKEGHAFAFAPTAPEAICIAALRACGVEVAT